MAWLAKSIKSRVALVAPLVVALTMLATVSASAQPHITASPSASQGTDAIAVNPASAGAADTTRTRFEYQLNSGQPARDSIFVINTGTSDQAVTLYARDAFSGDKGDFLIQDESVQPTDVGSWVRFSGGKTVYKFTLKPRGYVTIPFDVLTPSNATPGDHVGAIVASAETTGSTVNIVRRVAVRLYARLSGQLKARLKLENVSSQIYVNPFNPFAANNVVSYDITNVGNVELAADMSVKTDGPLGMFGGAEQSLRVTNLLPGSKRHITQTVDGAGQLIFSTTKVIFTGLLTSDTVAAQQPRGREDLTSVALPTGWLIWLGAAAAVFLLVNLGRRAKKPRTPTRSAE